jgi:hypothetical protein
VLDAGPVGWAADGCPGTLPGVLPLVQHPPPFSGLGLHTAADVHHGTAAAIQASRARVLTAAYSTRPERFVRKPPVPPALPATSEPRDGASYRDDRFRRGITGKLIDITAVFTAVCHRLYRRPACGP